MEHKYEHQYCETLEAATKAYYQGLPIMIAYQDEDDEKNGATLRMSFFNRLSSADDEFIRVLGSNIIAVYCNCPEDQRTSFAQYLMSKTDAMLQEYSANQGGARP